MSRTQLISNMALICWGILHPLIYPIVLFTLVLVNLADFFFFKFIEGWRDGSVVAFIDTDLGLVPSTHVVALNNV